jgi:hypothetical protein
MAPDRGMAPTSRPAPDQRTDPTTDPAANPAANPRGRQRPGAVPVVPERVMVLVLPVYRNQRYSMGMKMFNNIPDISLVKKKEKS